VRALAHSALIALLCAAPGCGGDDDDDVAQCDPPLEPFAKGDDGHADPLGAEPGEVRAGRLTAADLDGKGSYLLVWAPGDFVLANDHIALVIEDVGPSDLYDPWGGRPVGLARVADGALFEPADFGEFFILTGRNSVVTESVSVLNDGSDGEAATVRAIGTLAPTPFLEPLLSGLFREEYRDVTAAIDYVLEPDADYVDIFVTYNCPRLVDSTVHSVMHAYMYTPRMPTYAPGLGFDTDGKRVPYLAFVDDDATSYAYLAPGEALGGGINESGFASNFTDGFDLPACSQTKRHHARLVIGGPGLDPLLEAVARVEGTSLREISGTVRDAAGDPATGVRVHAENEIGQHFSRRATDEAGAYALHVPSDEQIYLTAWRRGDAVVGPTEVAADQDTVDIDLPATGSIHVVATDADNGWPLPVRVQVLPVGTTLPSVPDYFGEPGVTGGRLHVEFPTDGETTLRAPVGDWEVVVSRGYEYELHRETVTVVGGETVDVTAPLAHVVDTTGVMCADFHTHTHRSADAPDHVHVKLSAAAADGLDIMARSDHEHVSPYQPAVEELGLEEWVFGVTSVELTTMELYGHFGVLFLEPDPYGINGGTPLWQRYPSAEDPTAPVETLTPPELFAQVRARPEHPVIVINHPMSATNYFGYCGFDPATGEVERPELWDEEFVLVEVFNGSGWLGNRGGTVAAWLSLLDHGRRVFAVGSSDSHKVMSSPVGYPRTCVKVGTDDPLALTSTIVRDAVAAGHSTIVGGIYVDTSVGSAGPGDEATGTGATATVHVRVQAASWVDVDSIDVVVDGATVDTIAITPEDADPANPAIRYEADLPVAVAAAGSYVIVAAYGNQNLDPVHPGRAAFGVTNPIFLAR